MKRAFERLFILFLLAATAAWPVLLGRAVAGERGMLVGLFAYAAMGGVLLVVLVFGGIRGILDP